MNANFLQRLGLDTFEDRLLPSHLLAPPERPAHEARFIGERDFRLRDHSPPHHHPLRDAPVLRGERIVIVLPRASVPSPTPTPAESPREQVVVLSAPPVALRAEAPPTVSIAALTASTPESQARTPTLAEAAPTAPTLAASAAPAVNLVGAGVVLLGTWVAPALVVERPLEVLPVPSVVPETAPAPTRLEQVIEAIVPDTIPLAGLVPFHVADLDEVAEALLAKLEDLGVTVANDWLTAEQWAWVTGAALVAGGVAYAARVHHDRRRAHPVPPGAESALARWEDRHADRPA